MKKTDKNGNVMLNVLLGFLLVLAIAAFAFLTIGMSGLRSGSRQEDEIVKQETAPDRRSQEPVMVCAPKETGFRVMKAEMPLPVPQETQEVQKTTADPQMPDETAIPITAAETTAVPLPGAVVETIPQTAVIGAADDNDNYILPECSTRYYSKAELEVLDDKQLYLARNEIYARLGRKFKSDELAQYFGRKTWYHPKYESSVFDAKGDGVFNPYELANRNLIVSIEEERKGR